MQNYNSKLIIKITVLILIFLSVIIYFEEEKNIVENNKVANNVTTINNKKATLFTSLNNPNPEYLVNQIKDDRVLRPKTEKKTSLTKFLEDKKIPYQEKGDLVVVTENYNRVASKIETSDWIEFSEPEGVVKALTIPNDANYSSQSAYLTQISAQTGWSYGQGDSSVIIAIIDTGINGQHEDLSGRVIGGRNVVNSSDIGSGSDSDDNGHGTIVAGVLGANGNNSKGVAGIDWGATLMPVKTLNSVGEGTTSDLATGIDWAVSNGAKVINISAGTYTDSQAVKSAVGNAWNNNRIIVAASGNDGSRTTLMYPAKYENALAVASISSVDALSSFSNATSDIDVVAPGESIVSTSDTSTTSYTTASGTSVATPLVSGALGLIFSLDSNLTSAGAKSVLTSRATSLGYSYLYGSGKINIAESLAYSQNIQASWTGQSAYPTVTPGGSANMSITFSNSGSGAWVNSHKTINLGLIDSEDIQFQGSGWLNSSRISNLGSDISSGGNKTFNFTISIPSTITYGTYKFDVQMVEENVKWIPGSHAWWIINVVAPTASWSSQSVYPTIAPGSSTSLTIAYNNTGSSTWTQGNFNLGIYRSEDRTWESSWYNWARPATLNETSVAPGATGTFTFNVAVPTNQSAGTYRFYVKPVQENVRWIDEAVAWWDITVPQGYTASWSSQSVYPTISRGGSTTLTIYYRNTGGSTWMRGNFNLGILTTPDKNFNPGNWYHETRPATLNEASVAPGAVGSFTFTISVWQYANTGTYRFYVKPVQENVRWIDEAVAWWDLNIV